MKRSFLFTSESVTEGHPDRICDTISDALVDRFLKHDPYSKIVAECAIAKGVVFLAARFASNTTVDIPEITRSIIQEIGYRDIDFNAKECTVVTSLVTRPVEQRFQVDERELSDAEIDRMTVHNQITLFGFACAQTEELMPLPIVLARRLERGLTAARQEQKIPYLSPDGTTQVGVEFENGEPTRIHSITLISGLENAHDLAESEIQEDLMRHVIEPAFAAETVQPDEHTKVFVNPERKFIKSGPAAHSGMTGRKTNSDTYGNYARHSGSALSGKDPSRIDRVGAYAARYAAKNVVAAGLAEACEVQLSYTIGLCGPVSIQVETFGTGTLNENALAKRLQQCFDFRLGAIIRDFNLRHLPAGHKGGFYQKLPAHGHFGASFTPLPWERTDKADRLR